MGFRIFAVAFLLVSACAFPLLVTLFLGVACLCLFRNFYELIPIFFVHDVLYGVPLRHFFHFPYVMTLLAVVLVAGAIFLREHILQTGFGRRYA